MRILFGLLGLYMLAVPVSASARDREWRSIRIDVSALDLSTPAGMAELERRIGRAVNRVCDGDADCRDEAWASTEDQVAWAIDRDVWIRRMAEERIAQRDSCRWRGCETPRPAYYPVPPPVGGVTVVIVRQ